MLDEKEKLIGFVRKKKVMERLQSIVACPLKTYAAEDLHRLVSNTRSKPEWLPLALNARTSSPPFLSTLRDHAKISRVVSKPFVFLFSPSQAILIS
jgi:hypothetical protein